LILKTRVNGLGQNLAMEKHLAAAGTWIMRNGLAL
jgi:hypothetical protein